MTRMATLIWDMTSPNMAGTVGGSVGAYVMQGKTAAAVAPAGLLPSECGVDLSASGGGAARVRAGRWGVSEGATSTAIEHITAVEHITAAPLSLLSLLSLPVPSQ
eukprot:1452781-Prymnesium_polylepis.1